MKPPHIKPETHVKLLQEQLALLNLQLKEANREIYKLKFQLDKAEKKIRDFESAKKQQGLFA